MGQQLGATEVAVDHRRLAHTLLPPAVEEGQGDSLLGWPEAEEADMPQLARTLPATRQGRVETTL